MKLYTTSYNNGTSSYNAQTEEKRLLDFALITNFGVHAMVQIILDDSDGSMSQKYNVDTNDVFIGPGRAKIYEPDATLVFDGRIVKPTHDTTNGTLTLLCLGWSSLLDEDRETYDMREDLDGAGLRQSELKSDLDGFVTDSRSPTYTTGANYYLYDDDMDWSYGDHDGKYVVLPVSMTGEQTTVEVPYAYSLTNEAGSPGATDDENLNYTWIEDGNTHDLSLDSAHYFRLVYKFRCNQVQGSVYSSISDVKVNIHCFLSNSGVIGLSSLKEAVVSFETGAGWFKVDGIPEFDEDEEEVLKTYTIVLPSKYHAAWAATVDGQGYAQVSFLVYCTSDGGGTVFSVDKVELETTTTMTGSSSAITINKTLEGPASVDAAYRHDIDVGFTDETADLADDGAGDVQLLPNPCAYQDCFYFGFNTITSRLKITISQSGVHDGNVTWRYWNGSAWTTLSDVVDGTNDFEAAPGTYDVTWTVPTNWTQVAVNGTTKYWVQAFMASVVPNLTITPLATQGWAYTGTGNQLKVGTNCSITGLGLWEECPYAICQEIYKHLKSGSGGTLVTGFSNDIADLIILTANANIEATSGVSSRRFEEMTRWEMVKELAKAEAAVCWMPCNGVDLIYKKTFNNGAPTAITDADVDGWFQGEYDYLAMINEFHIRGIRIGDEQVYIDSTNITGGDPGEDSKSKFGVSRTQAMSSGGVVSQYDAEQVATALVEQSEDVNLFLHAKITGFSSLRIGDELSITSSHLGLSAAKYVVTGFQYDTRSWMSTVRLHPRSSTGYIERITVDEFTRQIGGILSGIERDKYIAKPTSNEA